MHFLIRQIDHDQIIKTHWQDRLTYIQTDSLDGNNTDKQTDNRRPKCIEELFKFQIKTMNIRTYFVVLLIMCYVKGKSKYIYYT